MHCNTARLAAGVLLLGAVACGSDDPDSNEPALSLQWEDVVDDGTALEQEQALAVAACDGRVFVSGYAGAQSGAHTTDFLVRAYDGIRGALLWEDRIRQLDLLGHSRSLDCEGGRVFVAVDFELSQALRAYDAADGTLLWENDLTAGTGAPWSGDFQSVVARGELVVTLVRSWRRFDTDELITRAFDAETGQFLWDHHDFASNRARGQLTVSDTQACTGRVNVDEFGDHSVICLDLQDGSLRWEAVLGLPTHYDVLTAPALSGDGSTLAMTGADDERVFVRAYDSATGTERWDVNYPRGTVLSDVQAQHDAFFVVGWEMRGNYPPLDLFALVDSLDVGSGEVRWENRYLAEQAIAAAPMGDAVAVVGSEWQIRLCDRLDGALLVDNPGKPDPSPRELHGVIANDDFLYLAGTLQGRKEDLDWDFAVRAYEAKRLR